MGFPGGACGIEPFGQNKKHKKRKFDPWVGKIPWRRKRLLALVFLPEESHGQSTLEGTVHRVANRVGHN